MISYFSDKIKSIIESFCKFKKKAAKRLIDESKKQIQYLRKIDKEKYQDDKLAEKNIDLSCAQIIEKIKLGELKSQDLILTYSSKALKYGDKLNLITETFIGEALETAKEYDQGNKNKELILYGLPITIKDSICVKDHSNCIGLSYLFNNPEKEDSDLVKVLKQNGAIPFLKTNVPQCLFSPECLNPIYGRAINPWDIKRSCGGSSGGCGGLVSLNSTPISIGSDIGGSLRMPANNCGITSLKPTVGRFPAFDPMRKNIDFIIGAQEVMPTSGVLGKSAEDIYLILKAIFQQSTFVLDPYMVQIPFREKEYIEVQHKKLRLGYFSYDGMMPVSAPVKRALEEVKEILQNQQHTIIDFKFKHPSDFFLSFLRSKFAEGNFSSIFDQLKNDPPVCTLSEMIFYSSLPSFVLKLSSLIYKWTGQRRMHAMVNAVKTENSEKYSEITREMKTLSNEFSTYWKNLNIDGLICPAFPCPAFLHNYSNKISPSLSYCIMFNVLNFPSGIIPITLVKKEEEFYLDTEKFKDKYIKNFKEVMKNSEGLPISIQVVTPPYHEEECLGIMNVVQKLVKFDSHPNYKNIIEEQIKQIEKNNPVY